MYELVKNRTSWGVLTTEGHYTGPALNHYHNFNVFPTTTSSSLVSDTIEFRHNNITVPQIIPADKVINAITKLKSELESIPTPNKKNQLEALENLRTLFSKCSKTVLPTYDALNKHGATEVSADSKTHDHESPRVLRYYQQDAATSVRVHKFYLGPNINYNPRSGPLQPQHMHGSAPYSRVAKEKSQILKRHSNPNAMKTRSNLNKANPISTRTRSKANLK